jgi:hypothetical protein
MAMLKVCAHPGCSTLTFGGLCVEHEAPAARPRPRKRGRVVPAVAAVSRSRGADQRRPGD